MTKIELTKAAVGGERRPTTPSASDSSAYAGRGPIALGSPGVLRLHRTGARWKGDALPRPQPLDRGVDLVKFAVERIVTYAKSATNSRAPTLLDTCFVGPNEFGEFGERRVVGGHLEHLQRGVCAFGDSRNVHAVTVPLSAHRTEGGGPRAVPEPLLRAQSPAASGRGEPKHETCTDSAR
jgi:hypothetical protein